MGLLAFMARVAGADENAYVRQALTTFGADGNPNTPRSTGTTACDTNGLAVMGRSVHDGKSGAASGAEAEALAPWPERAEAVVQNIDLLGGGYLLVWLEGKPDQKFVLAPLQPFTWKGADRIMVAALTGTPAWVAVER